MGAMLAEILSKEYGIPVVHDRGIYDMANGALQREGSYERMARGVSQLLDKYPSVEVTIDLHRDGVPDNIRLVTEINGLPTARIMFFNGITRLNIGGSPVELPDLPNPYLYENLGLSLHMQLTANTLYPGFARKLYIKAYRYSLHFAPRSLLIELGANTNTVQEARNALRPLAEVLVEVLNSEGIKY
jgi:stage II sporulation protein P